MKKAIVAVILIAVAATVFVMVAGCEDRNPSDTEYWFSEDTYEFVPYSEEDSNIDDAGSHWYFTSAKTVNVTMSVRLNVNNYSSAAYLYVNGEQVKSEAETDVYTYVYKLSLNRGDKIELHAFWVNPLYADDEGFAISILTMTDESGKTYSLEEYSTALE